MKLPPLRPLALAFALPALAAGAFALRSGRSGPRPAAASAARPQAPLRRQGCPLAAGDRLTFRLQAQENVTGKLAAASIDLQITTRASLHLRALGALDGLTLAAARLTETTFTDDKGQPIDAGDTSAPFLLKVRPDCTIDALGRLPDAEPRGARAQQALARSLEWRIDPARESYQARQSDGVGSIELRYGHGLAHDGAEVVQRRATALPALWPRSTPARGEVQRSFGEARLGAGPWFDRSHEEQSLKIQRNGADEHIERSMTIERVEPPPIDPLAGLDLDPTRFVWGDLLAEAPEAPPPPSPDLAARDLGSLIDEATQIERATRQGKGHRSSARLLAAYLRAAPAAAAALAERLRSGAIPRELRAPLALALSLADTAEARAALLSIARDRALAFDDRLRALHAAATTRHPGASVASALSELSRGREPSVAAAATLALGTLAGSQKSSDPALAQGLRDQLRERLDQERDPTQLTALLEAAGNAVSADLYPAADRLGAHSDPSVRAAAVEALGAMATPEASARLAALIDGEPDPATVRAMLRVEADRSGRPSAALVSLASRRLGTETDPGVSRTLIEMLGRALTDAAAREALIARFRTEKDPATLQLLGRFVPASELP